jgi:hypothetical protein
LTVEVLNEALDYETMRAGSRMDPLEHSSLGGKPVTTGRRAFREGRSGNENDQRGLFHRNQEGKCCKISTLTKIKTKGTSSDVGPDSYDLWDCIQWCGN